MPLERGCTICLFQVAHDQMAHDLLLLENCFCPGQKTFRAGGEGGGSPKGKFTKLGEKVNFRVLSWKLNVIRAKRGAISLFLTNKTSFSC